MGEDGVFGEVTVGGGSGALLVGRVRMAEAAYGFNGALDIAVSHRSAGISRSEGKEEFGDVAGFGSDIEHGRADAEDVVDFAGVNESDERVSHDDHVEIGRGE